MQRLGERRGGVSGHSPSATIGGEGRFADRRNFADIDFMGIAPGAA
ncbi:hypothetical protein [Nannocystis exedens]|nr:hypothetical protein [Nannocystis exedens]